MFLLFPWFVICKGEGILSFSERKWDINKKGRCCCSPNIEYSGMVLCAITWWRERIRPVFLLNPNLSYYWVFARVAATCFITIKYNTKTKSKLICSQGSTGCPTSFTCFCAELFSLYTRVHFTILLHSLLDWYPLLASPSRLVTASKRKQPEVKVWTTTVRLK